jgi:yeast amino acid transporter
MADKKVEEMGPGVEKGMGYDAEARLSASHRRSSAVDPELLAGELFDERYERTQRGLKSR